MKIAVRVGKAAAVLALALPVAAKAQYTGVSHPDDTPITNSPEFPQPVAAVTPTPPTTSQPALKPSPLIPLETASSLEVMHARVETKPAMADPDAGIVTRVAGPANQLPIGTLVKVSLAENISTATTASGTVFTARLIEPVERDGHVLLPAGSTLSGLVTDIHGGKRVSGAASVHLRTMSVTLPDGTRYQVRGQVIDTNLFKETKVNREGTIIRRDHARKTAATVALTTGSGAAAGAVFGGPPGALIGAGVGAGISTVVWLKQDRQTELPVNTKVTFSLTEPLTVGGE